MLARRPPIRAKITGQVESIVHWSKLKEMIEDRFAASLRSRATLFFTRYRHAPDEPGRWALRLDGQEVASYGDLPAKTAKLPAESKLEQGQHNSSDFFASLHTYLSMSIEEALTSSDVLHRSLALLDARLGKRRLAAIDAEALALPVERACLRVRLQAEGLESAQETPPTSTLS